MTPLTVREVGLGAQGTEGGRAAAAGAGWAWLRTRRGPVHLTSARGPRTPLTAVVERVPVLEPGDRVRLDARQARVWRAPAPPPPAPRGRIAAACAVVWPHLWNDPRALALAADPLEHVLPDLAGRGPGLTPAGDDALLGLLLARRATGHPRARRDAALVLAWARRRSGMPSLALLRWAAHGEGPEPAVLALAALLAGDAAALAPAVRRLLAFGRTTGPAILTGLVGGLAAA